MIRYYFTPLTLKMSLSTLEVLPDEILSLIIQHSGDVPNIIRSFLGLNQRFNNIVLDRELRLLTDDLSLKPRDEYYNSNEFQQAINQLSAVNKKY